MNWRDFFYFSKGERRALIVLLCLITISWIWLLWSDKKQASPTETMHLQQPKTENRVVIGNNPPKPLGDSVQQKTPVSTPLSTVSPKSSKTRPTFRGKRTKPTSFPRTEKFPRGTLVELNMADTTTLKKVPGIGPVFANRIVKYRNLLGGFYAVSQLREVYGIDEERYQALAPWFVADTAYLQKLKVNELPAKLLRKHPYINYHQAKVIEQLRKQKGKLSGWENLRLLEEFTEADRQRLTPYLSFE